MSKMDRQLNSKKDKETIYEIYRACRLCGAGAGYKMPIIQNVVDLDDTDVELRQKVRDCVQIEVHQDDKMPPLICELCVDKVNDFYEFLEMCRQTNKRTRLRLGLPPQSMPRGAPDAGECILGLTEPVYVNEDSDGEPLSKQKKINPKVKVKREPELKVQLENRKLTESRASRFSKRAPTPPRMTRRRTTSKDDNVSLSRSKDAKSQKATPKSILKKDTKNEDNSLLTPRLKRTRDKEPVKLDTPTKRVKIAARPSSTSSPQTPKSSPKTSPRTASRPSKAPKVSPARPPSPPRTVKCSVCGQTNKTVQANTCHLRSHTVAFTSPKLACNPCSLWFVSADEAMTHHKQHRNKSKPYTCRRCETDFRHISSYDEHFDNNQCIPFEEVPDVKCEVCWHLFATSKLLDDHKCLGEDHRPGGKCSKCKRNYSLMRNLKKHQLTCTAKKKGELIVDPVLLGKLKPIQIRVSRCDPLLTNLKQEHYDVSNVTADFGLDKNCVYPYISSVSSLRIKSDPDGLDRMVDIQDEIKDEFYIEEDYIHWDSENTDSEEDESSLVLDPYAKKKKIDTLANLTLKTLFSKKCLGKVPKKKRRVKQEKNMFDSLLAETEDDVTRDINSIIDNLGNDDDFDSQKGDEESQKDEGQSQKSDDKELNDSNKSMDDSDGKNTNVDDNDIAVTDTVDDNDTSEKNEHNDVKSDVFDSSNDKNDICDDEVSKQKEKDISSASKNFNNVCNDKEGSNNNLSSNNDNNCIEDKINNGTININNLSFDYDDGGVISKKVKDISSSDSKDDNQNDGFEAAESKSVESIKIDYENSQDSNSVGGGSDSLLNNTQSDRETIDKISIDNATPLSELNTDETKSQSIDNISQDTETTELEEDSSQNEEKQTDFSQNNDKQTDFSQNDDKQTDFSQNDDKQTDFRQNNDKQTDYSQNTDSINESDYKNAISVIVNSGKSKILTDSEELDENSKLMAALDAQIGESDDNSRDVINENSRGEFNESSRGRINDNFNDKIALEDLISTKSDIDMIPEEFNFDA